MANMDQKTAEVAGLFSFHKLNEKGNSNAEKIQFLFTDLALTLDQFMTEGRSRAICLSKLEEACFSAKKAMAINLGNQEGSGETNG